jgi:hypothetical protein
LPRPGTSGAPSRSRAWARRTPTASSMRA